MSARYPKHFLAAGEARGKARQETRKAPALGAGAFL